MQETSDVTESIKTEPAAVDPAAEMLRALQETVTHASQSPLYAERLSGVTLRGYDDFRALSLTSREDLTSAGIHGTRAVPIERICHYGETSGTSGGAPNSTWLTTNDFASNARAIARRHPDVFSAGRILINRFPFMAAPAHLMQLVAQQGNGVSIPAGNINWDVPYPRALDLVQRTGAQILAGLPLEPIILAQLAISKGLDPAKDLAIDSFFLGGAPLPTVLQERIEQVWDARVIELYGSTETMLLGTSCPSRSMHLETDLAHCEILALDSDEPVKRGEVGRLLVTTLGIEGSPLVRLDTGDRVRLMPACECGDPRPVVVVLGREGDVVDLAGHRLHTYEIIEAAAAAANVVDSSVFFTVVLADRLLVRIESDRTGRDPAAAVRERIGDIPVEIELTGPNSLLDVENLSRSPSVYKPVLVSDWRGQGRHTLSVSQGMIEWPAPTLGEVGKMLGRSLRGSFRAFQLRREMKKSLRS